MTRNGLPVRCLAALAVLVGGAVHLQQWITVFRDQSIGPTFVVNAAASLAVAVALVATDAPRVTRIAVVAGLLLSIGSLAALVASRTVGLPGFEATGYDVAEIEAIVAEVVATVLLVASFVAIGRPVPAAEALAGSSQAPLGAG